MKSKLPTFTDTQDQSDAFNSYLSLLSRYGIVPKTSTIGLETAMTYKSYLALYLNAVYNITEDKTNSILVAAGINPDAYVDLSLLYSSYDSDSILDLLIKLRLAGVQLPDYSPKTLKKFQI
jgi:hypothetical protein